MKIRINKKEVLSGSVLLLIGGLTVLGSLDYTMGSLARMGPGYFPLAIGVIIMILGLMLFFELGGEGYAPEQAEQNIDDLKQISFKRQLLTWGLIIGAMLSFIVLAKYGGLVPATFSLVFIATFADQKNTFKVALITATVLTLFTVAVFHFGLQMQMPLFRLG